MGSRSFRVASNSTITNSNNVTISHRMVGSGVTLTKAGAGMLTFDNAETGGASNQFYGALEVQAGTLVLNTNLSGANISVNGTGELRGSGFAKSLSGTGMVGPGNSPGVLTVEALDPSGGLDFSIELTAEGSISDNATNDILRLTGETPFGGILDSDNEIRLFIDGVNLGAGQVFQGGFFTDVAVDFASQIQNATTLVYVQTPGGSVMYNGLAYDPLGSVFSISTVSKSLNFGSGMVDGQIVEFMIVPEPSTGLLILAGTGLILSLRRNRNRA